MKIANADNARTLLTDALTGNLETAVDAQISNGQRELVESTELPRDMMGIAESVYVALGFTFQPIHESRDQLFREATLPVGWRKKRTGQPMWSHIEDEKGRLRATVFYSSVFWDRAAHISLSARFQYKRLYSDLYGVPEERNEEAVVIDTATGKEIFSAGAMREGRDENGVWQSPSEVCMKFLREFKIGKDEFDFDTVYE